MDGTRKQRTYDHRLVRLVQETGDSSIATRLGVPRSTAAGWIRHPCPYRKGRGRSGERKALALIGAAANPGRRTNSLLCRKIVSHPAIPVSGLRTAVGWIRARLPPNAPRRRLRLLRPRAALVLENLALRQQLAVMKRTAPRPKLCRLDRVFWVAISTLWARWRDLLIVVKPETVVAWHRAGFRLFWRWRSRRRGRPPISSDVIALIRKMATENTGWGAPRIQTELKLLGHAVAESTVAKYMPKRSRDGMPSQSWRSFLKNHISKCAACDFFAVPTATFRMLFCFVLSHDRRQIVHVNVTAVPTADWTARQIAAAFPGDGTEPTYLHRDRDSVYDERFRRAVEAMGIEEVVSAARSPWQNPFCERVIGTIRRDCLDHVIVLGERHLLSILQRYVRYYNESRIHSALDGNSPIPRDVEPPENGRVVAVPVLGGLHHRYSRAA